MILNGQTVKAEVSAPAVTATIMVNDSMRTMAKPGADSPLVKNNRKGKWREEVVTPAQLAALVGLGYTWRAGINHVSNRAADVERLEVLALDFDGAPLKGEEGLGPMPYSPYTELDGQIALVYDTFSWTEQKPWKQRLVFFLSRPVSAEEYSQLYRYLLTVFTNADPACSDAIRFFYGTNRPVRVCRDVVLDVDKALAQVTVEKKGKGKSKSSKPASEGDKATKGESKKFLSPAEFVYRDVLEWKLGGDVEALFCLWKHDFKERTPDMEDAVLKLEGRNPFSATDSSGTSFVVSQLEGQLPLWYDRSNSETSANNFGGGHGGTVFEYWFRLHQDFRGAGKFSQIEIMASIYRHFGVLMPPELKILHYLDILRHRTAKKLRMNLLSGYIEYGNEQLPRELIPWFAAVTGVADERNAQVIFQCVSMVARENGYNPVQDHLMELSSKYRPNYKLWDDAVNVLFRIPQSDPKYALYNAYWQEFMKALIARVFHPGVKYEVMLILSAAVQGNGKTSTIRRILDSIYADGPIGEMSRDQVMSGRKYAIHLKDDLGGGGLTKKASSELRRALSLQEHDIREPYAAQSILVPVSWVFVGTTNDSKNVGLFNDNSSGGKNRRFHVIPAHDCMLIDPEVPEQVKQDVVGTLWATAMAEFKKLDTSNLNVLAQQLVLPREFWDMSAEENNQYQIRDLLLDKVDHFLATKLASEDEPFTTMQLHQYLDNVGDVSDYKQGQISRHLENLGYERVEQWYKQPNGNRSKRRIWRKVRAEQQQQNTALEQATSPKDLVLAYFTDNTAAPAPVVPAPAAPAPVVPAPVVPAPAAPSMTQNEALAGLFEGESPDDRAQVAEIVDCGYEEVSESAVVRAMASRMTVEQAAAGLFGD